MRRVNSPSLEWKWGNVLFILFCYENFQYQKEVKFLFMVIKQLLFCWCCSAWRQLLNQREKWFSLMWISSVFYYQFEWKASFNQTSIKNVVQSSLEAHAQRTGNKKFHRWKLFPSCLFCGWKGKPLFISGNEKLAVFASPLSLTLMCLHVPNIK